MTKQGSDDNEILFNKSTTQVLDLQLEDTAPVVVQLATLKNIELVGLKDVINMQRKHYLTGYAIEYQKELCKAMHAYAIKII